MTLPLHVRSSRRSVLAAGGAALLGATAAGLSMPAFAQRRTVKLTLPWLAEGASAYIYVAKELGYFSKRGIDLQISRGFGSVTAAQTIAAGKFDIGTVGSPTQVMSVAQGLPLMGLGVIEYDASMGLGLPVDSPIKKPTDLMGKRIGGVPTSAEAPFFPAFCKLAGIDMSKLSMVQLDPKVRERALIDKQVDAVLGMAGSILPVILAQGAKAKFMLFKTAGIQTYGNTITVQKKFYESDPALCEVLVDAMMEGLRYTLLNPEEANQILHKAVPELSLTPGGKMLTAMGMGIQKLGFNQDEPKRNGLGWGDPKIFDSMASLVMEYVDKPGMVKPTADQLFTNRFTGRVKLTAAEWATVEEGTKAYRPLLA
ncbi:MAG: ABC transporter substrate-binding protein [Burkholderiaceae bacterium]|nr:ABC transporter substrate-binding protein [Burkholderiaceae bacterium]